MYIYLCLVEGQGQHGHLTHTHAHTYTLTHIHTYTHIHGVHKNGVQEKCFVHQSLQFFSLILIWRESILLITVYHSLTEINNCCNHYTIFW